MDIVLTTSTMSVSSRAKEEESFSRAQDRADSGSDTPSRPFNSAPSLRTGTRGGGREDEGRRRKGREREERREGGGGSGVKRRREEEKYEREGEEKGMDKIQIKWRSLELGAVQ